MLTADMANPPMRLIRALLFCALAGAGVVMSLEDAGEAISEIGLHPVGGLLARAWVASMSEYEPSSEPLAKVTWLEAWGLSTSRDGLGLTDEQWMDMTPRQIRMLHKLRLDRIQSEEFLVGIVTSHIVNFSMAAPKKPVKAVDFMVHKFPEPKPEPITAEFIAEQFRQARLKGGNV